MSFEGMSPTGIIHDGAPKLHLHDKPPNGPSQ